MQTIPSVQPEALSGPARRLLETTIAERGGISNMLTIMAQSEQVLDAYLHFTRALEGSTLDPVLRERIALTVAQMEQCEYSLAEHGLRARRLGLQQDEILASREGRVANRKTEAALRFARALVRRDREQDLNDLKTVGYSDREIVDIVACAGLTVFENLFNAAAKPEVEVTAQAA